MARSERGRWWWLHGAVLRDLLALSSSSHIWAAYPAYDCPTPLAVAHHIAGAFADATSRQAALQDMSPLVQSRTKLLTEVIVFILAMKRMSDELAAIFKQIRAKLPAST